MKLQHAGCVLDYIRPGRDRTNQQLNNAYWTTDYRLPNVSFIMSSGGFDASLIDEFQNAFEKGISRSKKTNSCL